jgi:ATP-dependent Clp protease ATP-binding subunit ClpC
MGLRQKYEEHHGVKITDEALKAAAYLSSRYITDRFLPDKAIDLIDEAGSKVRLKTYKKPDGIKELENKIKEAEEKKEEAIKTQDFETAATLRDEAEELKKQLDDEKEKTSFDENNKAVVDKEIIAEIVSNWTGVPVKSLTEEESQRLLRLEEVLHDRVIGQNEAVTAISKAIRRGRVGLKDESRPIGSFIFLGPTGVGKTELSKALAAAMFGSENAMIRLDMSEYMEKHTVSRMIGSPPGYVGFDEGGQLTEKVRRNPYSVVLFDEIEKAHPDVFNILLQILDDGILTDSQGRKIDFKNTVIIMTSNIGARLITEKKKAFGFAENTAEAEHKDIKESVIGELKKAFRPEFLNRVDDTIVFTKLSKDEIGQIAGKMLSSLSKRLKKLEIDAVFDKSVEEKMAEAGFDDVYGARPLRRAIQSKVEDALSEKLLSGEIKAGDKIICSFSDELIVNKN